VAVREAGGGEGEGHLDVCGEGSGGAGDGHVVGNDVVRVAALDGPAGQHPRLEWVLERMRTQRRRDERRSEETRGGVRRREEE
jgi:hypothetical protein